MPNRFTAVPHGPVPRPGRAMRPVLVIADVFMTLMLSRPAGLSLRSAWVTPATLALASLCTAAATLLAAVLIARGGWLSTAFALALLAVALGSAAVVVVGIHQRRAR